MSSIEKIREDIIQMQQWAAQNPKANDKLLTLLSQVRSEIERIWISN